jgi:O-antigen biosynthesis protein
MTLGDKHNRACELARGALVAHWDDDDWSAPRRLGYQVRALERSGAALCGLRRQPFIDFAGRRAWCFEYPPARRQWVSGSSLCYLRELWERLRFPAADEGSDTRFVLAPDGANALALDDTGILVALLHERNTSSRPNGGPRWRPRPFEEVAALLGPDVAFYATWAGLHTAPPAGQGAPDRV